MASVTLLEATGSWFIIFGSLGSANTVLTASNSVVEDTDMVRM